jgi:hypothetical protein
MNLYLVGHGYIVRTVPAVTVPTNFTLKFYCREDTEFDSSWETDVASGAALAPQYAPGRGLGQWEVTTVNGGQTCADHLLTRPGGMRTLQHIRDMKEIKTTVAVGCMVAVDVVDGDALCIKSGGKQITGGYGDGLTYTYLSDILVSLRAKVSAQATIHWCACRSTKTDIGEIAAQASGQWMGTLL